MQKVGSKPEDYDYAVFHQPNGKFPVRVAKQLGFSEKQIEVGLLTPFIGNTYSGAVPLGLAAILDVAEPDAGSLRWRTALARGLMRSISP